MLPRTRLFHNEGAALASSIMSERPADPPHDEDLSPSERRAGFRHLACFPAYVERADGETVYDSPLANALETAGFRPTPRGLRLRS